jgi:hypothetical protein
MTGFVVLTWLHASLAAEVDLGAVVVPLNPDPHEDRILALALAFQASNDRRHPTTTRARSASVSSAWVFFV